MNTKATYLEPEAGLDRLLPGEVETLAPAAGEVTVRLRASSLNFHDYGVVSGMRGPSPRRLIPMSDGAGEVVAVGAGVDEFSVGDAVVSVFFPTWLDGAARPSDFSTVPGDGVDGFAREAVTLPATCFTPSPRGYSHAEAATLTTAGVTAWRALFVDGALKPGETVLVQGTGGVSLFALQLAKAAGATVVATSSSDAKLERLRALGADHLINYRKDADWGRTAQRLAGGVDHVVEVGGMASLAQSIEAARPGGHIAIVGALGSADGGINLRQVLRKHLHLAGLLVGSRRHQLELVRALEASGVRPQIDRHFALDDIADAFRHQAANRHFGKIVLDI